MVIDLESDPWLDDIEENIAILESVNLSNLASNKRKMLSRKAHASFIQEHSLPKANHGKYKTDFKKAKRTLILSELDPDVKNKALGGVGAIVADPRRLIQVTAITDAFKAAQLSGRVGCYAFNLHAGHTITVYVIYGYTGGNQKARQARKTNRLAKAIVEEAQAQPSGPCLIVGDFNMHVKALTPFANLISDESWVDVGAEAQIWKQPKEEHTCVTATTKNPSRIDFILANSMAFPMIKDFRVKHDDGFEPHSVLKVKLAADQIIQEQTVIKKPRSLYQIARDQAEEDYAKLRGSNQTMDEEMPYQAWHAYQEALRLNIDEAFKGQKEDLQRHLDVNDADSFWKRWSETFEKTITEYIGLDERGARQYHGHGQAP